MSGVCVCVSFSCARSALSLAQYAVVCSRCLIDDVDDCKRIERTSEINFEESEERAIVGTKR